MSRRRIETEGGKEGVKRKGVKRKGVKRKGVKRKGVKRKGVKQNKIEIYYCIPIIYVRRRKRNNRKR
jgi:hypothetical protein